MVQLIIWLGTLSVIWHTGIQLETELFRAKWHACQMMPAEYNWQGSVSCSVSFPSHSHPDHCPCAPIPRGAEVPGILNVKWPLPFWLLTEIPLWLWTEHENMILSFVTQQPWFSSNQLHHRLSSLLMFQNENCLKSFIIYTVKLENFTCD